MKIICSAHSFARSIAEFAHRLHGVKPAMVGEKRAGYPVGDGRKTCAGAQSGWASRATEAIAAVKPKLRGVVHGWSFPVSIVAGAILVIAASGGRERLALGIYAISLSALLGTSALYHRVKWARPDADDAAADHAVIYLLIAGT